jgi:hypothetical protein
VKIVGDFDEEEEDPDYHEGMIDLEEGPIEEPKKKK